MQPIDFAPLGRKVSCLALGCGGLDGRFGLRRSAKMIETALDLGINYFDVAPAYGTAEEALGKVIGNSPDVVIATKVGLPRAGYPAAKMLVRELTKPVLDRSGALKRYLARGRVAPKEKPARPRYDFSMPAIERSLEQSLQCLRRDKLDVLLAHEPHPDDIGPELTERFETLLQRGSIEAYGVGIEACEDRWQPFGSIWQSAWPGEQLAAYAQDMTHVFHRVIRNAERDSLGRTTVPAVELVRQARRRAPQSVLIVSASTPARLRQLVEASSEIS